MCQSIDRPQPNPKCIVLSMCRMVEQAGDHPGPRHCTRRLRRGIQFLRGLPVCLAHRLCGPLQHMVGNHSVVHGQPDRVFFGIRPCNPMLYMGLYVDIVTFLQDDHIIFSINQ